MEQDPRETDSTGKYQNVKKIRNFTSKTSRPCLLRVQNPLRAKPPFIVELKGVNVNDPVYLYFILQYVPGGELFSLLRSKVSFPLLQAKIYIAHIVTIFEYLHSKNIIYRDLKPENILITKSGYLKLQTLGLLNSSMEGRHTPCVAPLSTWKTG